MSELLSLSNELLTSIANLTHPSSLIDYACSNRRIFDSAYQALLIHRRRLSCRSLNVVHDRNPMTIVTALRNVRTQPELLWYLRSLETWGFRKNFTFWKSYTFDLRNFTEEEQRKYIEEFHDNSNLEPSFYGHDELQHYRKILMGVLHLTESVADMWIKHLQSGSDEPLKVLLMASAPRLSKVSFVEYNSFDTEVNCPSDPLKLLSACCRKLALLPGPDWPCFQSLTEVTVGHPTELRHPHDAFYPPSHVVAPLLLLPRIRKLELNLMMGEDFEDEEDDKNWAKPYVWEWEVHRSTCRDLSFDCAELAAETVIGFLSGIKELRTFSYSGGYDVWAIFVSLLNHAKSSLEALKFDDNAEWDTALLRYFDTLRHLELSDRQLVDETTYKKSAPLHHTPVKPKVIDKDTNPDGITHWIDFVATLPTTLETLRIVRMRHNPLEYEIRGFLSQLDLLVTAKSSTRFSLLHTICIAWMQPRRPRAANSNEDSESVDPWCVGLKALCGRKGIFLHSNLQRDGMNPFGCAFCDAPDQPSNIEFISDLQH